MGWNGTSRLYRVRYSVLRLSPCISLIGSQPCPSNKVEFCTKPEAWVEGRWLAFVLFQNSKSVDLKMRGRSGSWLVKVARLVVSQW